MTCHKIHISVGYSHIFKVAIITFLLLLLLYSYAIYQFHIFEDVTVVTDSAFEVHTVMIKHSLDVFCTSNVFASTLPKRMMLKVEYWLWKYSYFNSLRICKRWGTPQSLVCEYVIPCVDCWDPVMYTMVLVLLLNIYIYCVLLILKV